MVVVDKVLSVDGINNVKSTLCSERFPWFYRTSTALLKTNKQFRNFSFISPVYEAPYQPHDINIFTICKDILVASLERCGVQLHQLFKVRLNLYPNIGEQVFHDPHIDDHERPIHVGIFYLTTNIESPTVLFAEKFKYGIDLNGEGLNQLNIHHRIDSVENRFVLFENHTYHCSSTPKYEDVRININYNFSIK